MEPFEKLEIILEGMINEKKKEVHRARNAGIHPAEPYIQGLEHELIGFVQERSVMHDIKNNGGLGSDEAMEKIWKPSSND